MVEIIPGVRLAQLNVVVHVDGVDDRSGPAVVHLPVGENPPQTIRQLPLAVFPAQKPQSEHEQPIKDLDEGDHRDAREEAQRAADGRDHVEDAGPQLQVDLSDDRRVEEEVQHGDVLSEPLLRELRVVGHVLGQHQHALGEPVDEDVFGVQEVVGQGAAFVGRVEPVVSRNVPVQFVGFANHGGEEVDHFAIVEAIALLPVDQIVFVEFEFLGHAFVADGAAHVRAGILTGNVPRRTAAFAAQLSQSAFQQTIILQLREKL